VDWYIGTNVSWDLSASFVRTVQGECVGTYTLGTLNMVAVSYSRAMESICQSTRRNVPESLNFNCQLLRRSGQYALHVCVLIYVTYLAEANACNFNASLCFHNPPPPPKKNLQLIDILVTESAGPAPYCHSSPWNTIQFRPRNLLPPDPIQSNNSLHPLARGCYPTGFPTKISFHILFTTPSDSSGPS
jgi:hypothetical protein